MVEQHSPSTKELKCINDRNIFFDVPSDSYGLPNCVFLDISDKPLNKCTVVIYNIQEIARVRISLHLHLNVRKKSLKKFMQTVRTKNLANKIH